jgi:predicted glycosyltransferase
MMQVSELARRNEHHSKRENVPEFDVAFAATGKTGLGHLRRITNVAAALHKINPYRSIGLFTNAEISAISDDEGKIYKDCISLEKGAIAQAIIHWGANVAVVDTAIIPGIEQLHAPLCLILRETVQPRLADFRLPGRKWDLVIVPNPDSHWLPDADEVGARAVRAVGWIFRETAVKKPQCGGTQDNAVRRILLASGGGGSPETASRLRGEADAVLLRVKQDAKFPVEITQAAGPRMPDEARSGVADYHVTPGASLNEIFADYDMVISTAGYNSVLELAALDVPVVLLPIARSMDDQVARAQAWSQHIGWAHEEGEAHATADWVVDQLLHRRRRHSVILDPLGASRAAGLIMQLAGTSR